MGGDEFAVLLRDCGIDNARRIAESLRATVENFRFIREDRSFSVGASIGLVALADEVHDLNDILVAADQACYEAKRLGRNRVVEASVRPTPRPPVDQERPRTTISKR